MSTSTHTQPGVTIENKHTRDAPNCHFIEKNEKNDLVQSSSPPQLVLERRGGRVEFQEGYKTNLDHLEC